MQLADHIRPLLRDHDCVIIPDFGGLVADAAPARLQPGRQVLSPPTKLVAFNQALTRNDGLLVDALAQHQGISIAQAREAVRQAVARLQQDLQETNRTELPGIGIFRRAVGRGLSFEYTGADNLLPAAYGLPEVVARPVQATNARLAREKSAQPALRVATAKRGRLARVLPAAAVAVVAVLLISANYLMALRAGYVPTQWQVSLAGFKQAQPAAPVAVQRPSIELAQPQQATLGEHTWSDEGEAAAINTPAELPATEPEALATPEAAPTAAPDAWTENTTPEAAPVVVEKPVVKALATKPEPVADKVVKNEAAAPAAKVAAPATATTIKARTGRFYVIAGAFKSLAGAEKVRKAQKNGRARVLMPPPGSRLYRLSVADFADKAAADAEARRLRTKAHSTNSHLVLNY